MTIKLKLLVSLCGLFGIIAGVFFVALLDGGPQGAGVPGELAGVVGAGGLLAGAGFLTLGIRTVLGLVERLRLISVFAESFGAGDLSVSPGINGIDELGDAGAGLNAMARKLRLMFADIATSGESMGAKTEALATVSRKLTESMATLESRAGSANTSAEEMNRVMRTVSDAVTVMNDQMTRVSVATGQSSNNIDLVAHATEEMSQTIADIAANTEKARRVTGTAVANVTAASSRVDELGAAARQISKVTDVIVEIAEQTKLLALNATIEAARAGEAGKGFAVVANEVKELASQTNNAIAEIRQKVEAMQNSTDNTIREISEINQIINDVNEIVVSIASAVEEQSMTTNDIAQNIAQAVTGIRATASTVDGAAAAIQGITENVGKATGGVATIGRDISDLSASGGDLRAACGVLHEQVSELGGLSGAVQAMIRQFRI